MTVNQQLQKHHEAEIPTPELWLYKNPKAHQSVQRRLDQAEKGHKKIKQRFF